MRTALLLALLSLTPALAEAGVDFKCESVKYEDQIVGWIRFGFAARNNSVSMEYWNGFPPITLVDAKLDNGTNTAEGIRYVSEPDRLNDTVATLDLPKGAHDQDSFQGKIDMRYKSRETGKLRVMQYDLKCVRH